MQRQKRVCSVLHCIYIEHTKKNTYTTEIESDVTKCTKEINAAYDDVINAVTVRKQSMLERLKEIAEDKVATLNEKHEEMQKNSATATSVH